MTLGRADIRISGQVQGVFFRQSVKAEAERLGLTGWVRNEPDGSVRVAAEGAEDKLQELIEWCKKGAEWSRVENVEVDWKEAAGGFKGFAIR